jgi:hypothetical protein
VREVRGGVAGWLEQRRQAAAAPQPSAPSPTSPRPARQRPSSGRSPSTVRRQLAQAERDMAAATQRRDALLADLGTATDHRELTRLGDELTAAQACVDQAEEAWLALADEAEALGLDLSD